VLAIETAAKARELFAAEASAILTNTFITVSHLCIPMLRAAFRVSTLLLDTARALSLGFHTLLALRLCRIFGPRSLLRSVTLLADGRLATTFGPFHRSR
jgi:hypothetical protein